MKLAQAIEERKEGGSVHHTGWGEEPLLHFGRRSKAELLGFTISLYRREVRSDGDGSILDA